MIELPQVDWNTGRLVGPGCLESTRTLADVMSIFGDQAAARAMAPETPVYTTYGLPDTGQPELLYATTVIYPGQVGNEYLMTRGHFHTNVERGEFNVTIRGEGAMIVMDRDRRTSMEKMQIGSIHNVDGRLAHRVANTGNEPLIFLCVWMSDCGHDYQSIMDNGFGARLIQKSGQPQLIAAV